MKLSHALKSEPRRPTVPVKKLVTLADGEIVTVRLILPTDIFGCYAMYQSLSPETRRYSDPFPHRLIGWSMWAVPLALSSIGALRRLLMNLLPRAVTLGYVATNAKGKIVAFTFLKLRKPTYEGYIAESGTFIAEDYQSRGLGTCIMKIKIEEGRQFGIRELIANVHSQNRKMIGLCRKTGYTLFKEIPPNRLLLRLNLDNKRKSKGKQTGLIQ